MIRLSVCGGMGCRMFGSEETFKALQQEVARQGIADRVDLFQTFCMGECSQGPCVRLNGVKFRHLDPANVAEWVEKYVMPAMQDTDDRADCV